MTTYPVKTDSEVLAALKSLVGDKNVRVTKNGEVHVLAQMPNTNQFGWFLLGFTGDSALEALIWNPDGSLRHSLES